MLDRNTNSITNTHYSGFSDTARNTTSTTMPSSSTSRAISRQGTDSSPTSQDIPFCSSTHRRSQSPQQKDLKLATDKLPQQDGRSPRVDNLIEYILAQASARIEQAIDKELTNIWSDNSSAEGTRTGMASKVAESKL